MSILRRIARHMRLERKASDRALHHKLDGAFNHQDEVRTK